MEIIDNITKETKTSNNVKAFFFIYNYTIYLYYLISIITILINLIYLNPKLFEINNQAIIG